MHAMSVACGSAMILSWMPSLPLKGPIMAAKLLFLVSVVAALTVARAATGNPQSSNAPPPAHAAEQ